MAHFSEQVQFKIMSDMVRLSFRVQDQCVIEHLILVEDFQSIVHCSSEVWVGTDNIQAKRKDRNVLIRILGNTRYVYSIPTRTFSVISNEFLSREV